MGNLAMAIIVDEFTSSPAQGALARALVSEMIGMWHREPSVERDALIAMMRQAHTALRMNFRLSSAAYGLIATQRGNPNAVALVAGDCRIGSIDGGMSAWLTQPHTKEAAMICLGLVPGPGDRSTVTRCFKPRRWMEPDVVNLFQSEGTSWVLATDGFDCEPAMQSRQNEDDSSRIIFAWRGIGEPETDEENWQSVLPQVEAEAG